MGTSFTTMPEPHEAICSEQTAPTLNLVAAEQEHVVGPRTRSWIAAGSARPRRNEKGRREFPPAHCQPPAASYLTKSISR